MEYAVRRLRRALGRRVIARVRAHHPAQRRTLTPAVARAVAGRQVRRVERRGKHQLVHLDDGAVLLIHFRMNGDWVFDRADTALPAHARVTFELDNGRRAVLVDSRALCTVHRHAAGTLPDLGLGPEPEDPALTPSRLRVLLAARRAPIKSVLLDQSVLAGVGNELSLRGGDRFLVYSALPR